MKNLYLKSVAALCLASAVFSLPALAEESAPAANKERVMAITVDAEITGIDQETREVTLRTPLGDLVTVTAGSDIERLHDFAVGDVVSSTYIASLEGEVREPTEAEIAEPWIEIDAAAKSTADMDPGAIAGRVIQAVCTIEGMNRVTRSVMVRDPRGKYHVIGDVEPEKLEGVTLGTTLVLTYSEAIAVSLIKKQSGE